MARKRPQNKKKRSPPSRRRQCNDRPEASNWVDSLGFKPLEERPPPDESGCLTSNAIKIRVISWNALAESYCSRRSHRHLPRLYQHVAFSPKERRALLRDTLRRLAELDLDIFCLQELDLVTELSDELRVLGFRDGAVTPTTRGGGAGARVDAVVIYARSEVWSLVEHQVLRLDDLATLGTSGTNHQVESSLEGLKQGLLRRNMALVTRFRHIASGETIVVANAHLHWNPAYEYVKLCQCHYVMQRTKSFAKDNEPIIFCGDLNSKPSSSVHDYLAQGHTNAKLVAPWYRYLADEKETTVDTRNYLACNDQRDVEDSLSNLQLHDTARETAAPKIRYLMDFTLNRFTRWLRILGIDSALETDAEEIERTKNGNMVLFERCRNEHRTLVTTSSKLTVRKDCPAGTYLVNPESLANLETAFVHLLLTHGVVLEPAHFLSRCVVCNGNIVEVDDPEDKQKVFAANSAPDLSSKVDDVYQCDGCGQGYWWSDNPSSSASRVKGQATRLFELCLRGGVPITGDLAMFDYVDIEAERKKGFENDDIELEHLEVTEWLKDNKLACPFRLESSYAMFDQDGNVVGEKIPFTNVTHDFVAVLDYVFYATDRLHQSAQLHVPTTFNELNVREIPKGHLLPSNIWPSDHLAIGAELILLPAATGTSRTEETHEDGHAGEGKSADVMTGDELYCGVINESGAKNGAFPSASQLPTTKHPPRCSCGCVPPIPSLFEMSELRKQAKQKAQQQKGGGQATVQ